MADSSTEAYPRKFGKYHLLGPLAQGGMGALYLAVNGDRGLERLMVIKTVLPHLADNEYIARFRDEAKVVVKLSHGNLIPVFDAGVVAGEMFLAMDFVEGRDLRAVWNRCAKKQVAFPIDVAVHSVKELCRGLSYAHTLSDLELVHRDVSPPNVLVSFSGEVKLTDFGLASSTLKLEKTAPGIIYGKVAYMSPEQARGEKLDGRSDLYAAGIVLWELLTGRQLFPPGKDQPQDLVSRAKNPEITPPSKRAPRVPPELDEICLRALSAERANRYQSCEEMRQALQNWLGKNAPTTDISRISTFMHDLFADDIVADRAARADMLTGLRKRALTLPPSDEFRQLVERSAEMPAAQIPDDTDSTFAEQGESDEAPVRRPGSVGRRADDIGVQRMDRRKVNERRNERGGAALAIAEDPEAEPNLLNTVVDNRYRVVELIGEGGMGKVYLAEHVEIGRRVALKVLHPSYGRMPDLVERFRREARAASKIGHPNIVDVTDSGTTADGQVFFVMEYLEGVELGGIIDREGAIDVARTLRIASQICRALAAAHNVGIIHRDLKPENVFLITREGTADFVKVLDFGIAKTTEAEQARERKLTSPGMAMGTPEYMAPEQAAGRPADARCDVYALGAIVFEMLTGVAPYQGDNFMEILTKKATIDPVSPSTLRPNLPDAVSAVVMSAMARNPAHRPQTMEAFEYELNKCLAGRGVAVAQILGMSSDANLVANLNPGLSGGTAPPSAQTYSRPVSNSGLPSASSASASSGPASSAPVRDPIAALVMAPLSPRAPSSHDADGQAVLPRLPPGAVSRSAEATALISVPTVFVEPSELARKSGFGSVLMAILLVGGAGALAFVAVGEWKARRHVATTPAPIQMTSQVVGAVGPAPVQVSKGSGSAAEAPQKLGSNASGTAPIELVAPATPEKPDKVGPDKNERTARPKPIGDGKKMSGKELVAELERLSGAAKMDEAEKVFDELRKVRGYKGIASYTYAYGLFQNKNYAGAARYAKTAANEGFDKPRSMELEGDAYLRLNEFDKAKGLYLIVWRTADTATKTTLRTKVNKCNA
ncbi:MAG: serine/threonine protein kinase, partial [Kofleriaceae bacterium]|nr:serine/threonine protein kinase [Kofleriaceae bacterium]